MKLGFSSLVCPTWSLDAMIDVAAGLGYAGIELRGLRGQLDLSESADLTGDPEAVKGRFAEAGLDLVCLGTSASVTSRKARERDANVDLVRNHVDLARRLGCPMVRVFSGDVPSGMSPAEALSQAGRVLAELGPLVARQGVTLVVENVGDLARSEDLWFLLDGADHPAVQCCWNPVHGLCLRERPTITVPRLGQRLGLVHLADAKIDERGNLERYVMPGRGDVEIERLINLLRGIGYEGYLIFEWPKLWVDDLPEPDQVLPKFKELATRIMDAARPVLTAYKGDKNAPKFKRAAS